MTTDTVSPDGKGSNTPQDNSDHSALMFGFFLWILAISIALLTIFTSASGFWNILTALFVVIGFAFISSPNQ
jgi:hypothetical protein